jgi:hypothetical protein
MSFSVSEDSAPAPISAEITNDELIVHLADGRTIITPLVWYPPLLSATPSQRANFVLGPVGIHWPDIDEDLSVAGMLGGVIPTYRWLNHKATIGVRADPSAAGERSRSRDSK